jgi:hypothetical protein
LSYEEKIVKIRTKILKELNDILNKEKRMNLLQEDG